MPAPPSTTTTRALLLLCLSAGFAGFWQGCADPKADEPAAETFASLTPAPPALTRLTRSQYANAVRELLGEGITVPAQLEPDVAFDGLFAIGASITPVSERGVELFEDAARAIATELVANVQARDAVVLCKPATHTAADTPCATQTIEHLGRRAWRRPLTTTERDRLVAIADKGATTLGNFYKGLAFSITALLQSPHFLYRPEHGQPDPNNPADATGRRFTSWEMASRLAFFVWNGPPDDALLDAAAADELIDDTKLAAQIDRMLAHERARRGVRAFFGQWLNLSGLDDLTKDPNIFKHHSAELGGMAREETLRLADHVVFTLDADLRTFFTSTTTFANRRLAAIYNVKAPAIEGFGKLELPADGQRRGFFGHVAFLALNAHPVSSSAVLRGVYVRQYILCDQVPPPPSNLNTAIPPVAENAKTMRERLIAHMADPACAGCHKFTDIAGLGFEKFDGIGRFRVRENGALIDDSGVLDGIEFSDFRGLTEAIAINPKLPQCFVEKMYGYATGRSIGKGEYGEIKRLTEAFNGAGRKVKGFMRTLALNPGFRRTAAIATPAGG